MRWAAARTPLIALPVITGKSTEEIFTESKVNNSRDDIERTRMDRRVMLGDGTLCYNENFNLSENIRDTAREIKNAQKKGLIITASTRDSFIQNTAKRAGGNEYEERGLYSHHAYTVIGIETKNDIDCVRLRNPWGDGGLLEVRNPLTGSNNIYWHERPLRNLCDRYEDLCHIFLQYYDGVNLSRHSSQGAVRRRSSQEKGSIWKNR